MSDSARLRAALSFICPDDRETWVRMGMAVKAELGPDGFEVWDQWSRLSDAYQPAAAKAVWKSFKGGGKVSAGSLFHEARRAGWRDDTAHAPEDTEAVERRRLARAAREQAERAQREASAARAALRGGVLWRAARTEGDSAYLARKGVEAESVRFLEGGALLVPMVRYDRPRESALAGVQVINADGSKRFTTGTAKTGAACRLGMVVVGQPVLLCEGLATGLTIRAATNRRFPVYVAFDAGNLMPVAEILRSLHPCSPLLVCADDDWQTKGNPGITKARAITKAVPFAHLIYPVFPAARGARDSDFNDLQALVGLAPVSRQFSAPLAYLGGLTVRTSERRLNVA